MMPKMSDSFKQHDPNRLHACSLIQIAGITSALVRNDMCQTCNSTSSSSRESVQAKYSSARSQRTICFVGRDFHFPITAVLMSCLSLWSTEVNAATIYWDGANTEDTNNVSTGFNLGGVGTWDNLTTANWWDGVSVGEQPWNNSSMDTAVFWGSAGVVTLNAPITAGALQFRTSGYTLSGNTLALTGLGAITAELGTVTTIASQLIGTNGLTLTGTGSSGRGAVRLTNASNNYSGTTTLRSGTLVITNDGQLGNTSNALAINGVQTAGLVGGSLLLAGSTTAAAYTTGLTLAATRSVTMTGGAVGYANSTPANSGSALISVGNNTISGPLTTSPTPLGSAATGAVSSFGFLTLSNLSASGTPVTNFTTLGSNGSIGGYRINGILSGTGSINKTGGGTLILAPTSASGFSGTIRVTAGSVRVADPLALGTNVNTGLNSVFDLNGGVFEIRADTFDSSTGGLPRALLPRCLWTTLWAALRSTAPPPLETSSATPTPLPPSTRATVLTPPSTP